MSGVGVLDKAVVILAACVDGASLAELVERTKLPRATAHRLAQALEIHRMLVRDTPVISTSSRSISRCPGTK